MNYSSTVEKLLRYNFPTEKEEDRPVRNGIRDSVHEHGDDDPEFTRKEVESVFRALSMGKAPGIDGLALEIVELHFRGNKPLFLVLLNKCRREGAFPRSWKKMNLVKCNKVNKDRSVVSSYRAICLLPVWSKVLDKLVTHRQLIYAGSLGFLHRNQFVITSGLETENELHELSTTVEFCHNRDNGYSLVMLDVKGAFNNLWWPSIFEGLKRIMRYPRNLFKLVKSFLSERKVIYRRDMLTLMHEYTVG